MTVMEELMLARRWRVIEVKQLKALMHQRAKENVVNAQIVEVVESCLKEGALTERLHVEEEAS